MADAVVLNQFWGRHRRSTLLLVAAAFALALLADVASGVVPAGAGPGVSEPFVLSSSTPTRTRTPGPTSAPTRTPTVTATATASATPTRAAADPNCLVTSVQNLANSGLNPLPIGFPTPLFQVSNAYPTALATPSATGVDPSVQQIYVNNVCISCNPASGSGALDPRLWKNSATLSPHSDWIVFQGEMPSHPVIVTSPANQQYMFNNGWWADLWVVKPGGSKWYNLSNLVVPPNGSTPRGTLAAQLSPDQSKLVWASLVGYTSPSAPVGVWRLMLADFVVDASGVPSLQNVRDLSAPNGTWFEPTSWSPDGTTVVVSSNAGLPYQYGADDFAVNVTTGTYVDLTNQPLYFEEHAAYSPHGNKIAHESEYPNATRLPQQASLSYAKWRAQLKTELYVMNENGSMPMQLSGANTPMPSGTPDPELNLSQNTTAWPAAWNIYGNQIIHPEVALDPATGKVTSTIQWLVTFAGPCG